MVTVNEIYLDEYAKREVSEKVYPKDQAGLK